MEPIENIEEVRKWYEITLRYAAKKGRDEFNCGTLQCKYCPFKTHSGRCGDDRENRTVQEWQQWWYELTGEKDTRTEEEINKGATVTEESTVTEEQPTATPAEPTGEDTTGADTLQPTVSAPNVDIIWTTAMGAVKHRHGPIALLGGEMQQFSRDVGVWISEMSKPDTCDGVADSIMFVARDETGAVLANVSIDASLFGKQKVWVNTTSAE